MPGSLTPLCPWALALTGLGFRFLPRPRHHPKEISGTCRGSITSRFRILAYEVRSIRLVRTVTDAGHPMFANTWFATPLYGGLSPSSFSGLPRAHGQLIHLERTIPALPD